MTLTLLFGTLGIVSFAIVFMVHACLVKRLRAEGGPVRTKGPRVAVLRPMKGADGGLRENLVALYEQTYQDYEIVMGAEDPMDPALLIAREVAASYPSRKTRIYSGRTPAGLNPKVRLLRKLVEFTTAEVLLVSDSNVRPDRDYLAAIVERMVSTGASLVHNVLMGRDGEGLGGRLEDLHLTTWVAGSVCFTDEGQHACVIGKSMLMQRAALDQVGGFQAVADYLAEDYLLGSLFEGHGKKVVLSAHALPVVNSGHGLAGFWNRHVRWGQMRRRISPAFYFGEVFSNPTPFLLAAVLFAEGPLSVAFGGAQLLKWGSETLVLRRLTGRFEWKTLALLPLKDALLLPIWLTAMFRRTIHWRGNVMTIGERSLLVPVEPKREPAFEPVGLPTADPTLAHF